MDQEVFDKVLEASQRGETVVAPGADLQGVVLRGANFGNANFQGAQNLNNSLDAAVEIIRQADPPFDVISVAAGALKTRADSEKLREIAAQHPNAWKAIKEILLKDPSWNFQEFIARIEQANKEQ